MRQCPVWGVCGKIFNYGFISEFMGRLLLWGILMVLFGGQVLSVSIIDISITDRLNTDLSMRETITIRLVNNSAGEFKLMLPQGAYDVTVNSIAFENLSVSEEIACDNCSANISYSYAGIVMNDSGNYTFYRKIDFPINSSRLYYKIVLPENHSLLNMGDLSVSIFPEARMIDNRTFEWDFSQPTFPKEFGVRYMKYLDSEDENRRISYLLIFSIAVITFIVLTIISVTMIFIKKRK